jgi:4,5-DOPA dioxygenase extradiol
MSADPVPTAFIGHGSPMNALEVNRWTAAWREFGAALPPLRAVVVISAHWYLGVTAVTAMASPRTIHDFVGFPPELFAVEYPAPGAPDVAREIASLLSPTEVVPDDGEWGLDHGAWSVLRHVVPDASVPVVQLSIDATLPLEAHVEHGRRLAPLRHDGVLVLGSGNVVHNLGRMDWGRSDGAFDWARRFDDDVRSVVTSESPDVEALAALVDSDDGRLAVPTPEHFLPLAHVLGAASGWPEERGRGLRSLVDGIAYGSVSMGSFVSAST